MGKVRKLAKYQVRDLTAAYTSSSGCTTIAPDYPKAFKNVGENERGDSRNEFLGMTASLDPSLPDEIVFGESYIDREDNNQHDEDYNILNTKNGTLTKLSAKELERHNPNYPSWQHHGDKTYLIRSRLYHKLHSILRQIHEKRSEGRFV